MAKNKKESFFWTSYSDLMTSLFFVMLLLFILTIILLHKRMVQAQRGEAATKAQLEKITELENSIKNIDTIYFGYDNEYKTHILKTKVFFPTGEYKIELLPDEVQQELLVVRDLLKDSLESFAQNNKDASYLLIIEGQASQDGWKGNNVLSYQRALSLFQFWFPNEKETNLKFFNLPCEVVIAGAGAMEGKPRESSKRERDNQRFLIRILPKPGLIHDETPKE